MSPLLLGLLVVGLIVVARVGVLLAQKVLQARRSTGRRIPGTDIVSADTRGGPRSVAQRVEQNRILADYLEAARKNGRIVRDEHFADMASHALIDHMCAVLQTPEDQRYSEDMRRLYVLFFEEFKRGDGPGPANGMAAAVRSKFTHKTLLPRRGRVSEVSPGPIGDTLGAQESLNLPRPVRTERHIDLIPSKVTIDKNPIED